VAKSKKPAKKAAPKKSAKKSATKKPQPKMKLKAAAKGKSAAKASPAKSAAKPATAKPGTRTSVPAKAKAISSAKRFNSASMTPLDDRLLITVEAQPETTAGGIIIPGTVSERPSRGTVVAAGRGRRGKKGKLRPLDVEVGDTVLFTEYAGTKIDGQELLILREEEVLGIVT